MKALIFCCLFFAGIIATENAFGQGKPRARTEQEVKRKKKEKKRKRKRDRQRTVKRKSRLLEKFYFGSKSNQIQKNSGFILLHPQKQSYGSMQPNEVKNPQVKNLKSFHRQKNYRKRHSRRLQRSLGAAPIYSGNKKMNYKFNSKTAQDFQGRKKYASPKKDFRRESRRQTKHQGKMVLQPEMLQKNYNEDRPGSNRHASRVRSKSHNRKESNYRSRSSQIQKHTGNILLPPNADKLRGKFNSKTAQNFRGRKRYSSSKKDLRRASRMQTRSRGELVLQPKILQENYNEKRAGSNRHASRMRSKSQRRKESDYRSRSAQVQKHTGNILLAKKAARLRGKYASKVIQQSPGNLKAKDVRADKKSRASRASTAANYAGEKRAVSRTAKRNYERYLSMTTSKYSGSFKALSRRQKRQALKGNSLARAGFKGVKKAKSKATRNRWNRKFSKYNVNYSGNYRGLTKKQKRETLEGTSLMIADYKGNFRRKSKFAQNNWLKKASRFSKYQGNLRTLTPRQKRQAVAGKSMTVAEYKGDFKAKSRSKREKWFKKASSYTGSYQGKLRTLNRKPQNPPMLSSYRGEIKLNSQRQRQNDIRRKAKITGNYQGDMLKTAKNYKELNYKFMSKIAHKHQGNIKAENRKKARANSERNALERAQYQGNILLPARDLKKLNYEFMSKTVHNYTGGIKAENRKKARANSERNAMERANFQGNILLPARDVKKLNYEFMSKTVHNYTGDIKAENRKKARANSERNALERASFQGNFRAVSQRKAEAESQRKAMELAEYQGEIVLRARDSKELNYKFMSKTVHNYEGNLKALSKNKKDRYYRELSGRNQQILGNYRLKYKFVRDLEYQIISARVHGYQGGPKTGWITRVWLKLFDNGDKLRKATNTVKKPKYDTREAEIWY